MTDIFIALIFIFFALLGIGFELSKIAKNGDKG